VIDEAKELFPSQPPVMPSRVVCTRANYNERIEQRWHGPALGDARRNWHIFVQYRDKFVPWVELFDRDCWLKVGEKMHNPEGTVRSLAWLLAETIATEEAGEKGTLGPLLDFEDHFQKVFLRRGFQIYLELLLEERK